MFGLFLFLQVFNLLRSCYVSQFSSNWFRRNSPNWLYPIGLQNVNDVTDKSSLFSKIPSDIGSPFLFFFFPQTKKSVFSVLMTVSSFWFPSYSFPFSPLLLTFYKKHELRFPFPFSDKSSLFSKIPSDIRSFFSYLIHFIFLPKRSLFSSFLFFH